MYKKFILFIFLVLDLFLSLIFYIINHYFYNIVEYSALNISIVIELISLIILKLNKQKNYNLNKKNILICIILTMLFLIILPINELLLNLNYTKNVFYFIYAIIHIIIFILSIFICLLKLFQFTISSNSSIKIRKKIILGSMICFLILIILYICSSNTGYYDSDFLFIYNHNMSDISNWHTFAYTIFVNIIKYMFHSPFLIIIIQSMLWLFNLYYSLKIIDRQTKNAKLLILFSIFQILLLVGFKQNIFLWKDTIFCNGLYLLCLVLLDIVLSKNVNIKKMIIFLVSNFIVSNFRHAGILITVFSMLGLFLYFKKNLMIKKYLILLFLYLFNIMLFFMIGILGKNVFKISSFPNYITYTVPIYQVGTFINNNYNFNTEEIKYLEKLFPLEVWKDKYIKYDGDSLSRLWSIPHQYSINMLNFNYRNLLNLNLKLFIDRPVFYLNSLLELQNTLWRITPVSSPYYGFFWSDDTSSLIFNDNGKKDVLTYKKGITFNIVSKIENMLFNNSLLFSIKSHGGFAIYILLICTILCIYNKNFDLLIYFLPLIIWWLLLMLSMPISITRYIIIFVISFPLILCLTLSTKKQ